MRAGLDEKKARRPGTARTGGVNLTDKDGGCFGAVQAETSAAIERAVIGAALVDPDARDSILSSGVASSWFCDSANARVWQAVEKCVHGLIEVRQYLLAAGNDALADRIHSFVDSAPPTTALISWHILKLREQRDRRTLRALGMRLTDTAPDGDMALMVEGVRRVLDEVESVIEKGDKGRSLADFARMEIDHGETLLGNRYLCRGGSMLFVGPSGVGKSSASCQQDVAWSLGRDAFGIRPARPLRILGFQAENDDGDQHEMAAGVVRGLGLTETDLTTVAENTRYLTRFETGQAFLTMMEREVERWHPDLVRIDPLNAFIGDDAKDPRAIALFCRAGINPILYRHRCGSVVAHHTPKVNFRDTTNWTALDWAYAGSGGADLTNWARAVLVVDPVNLADGVFRFIGAKRGARLGWRNDADEIEIERHFCYAREPGVIYWREPSEDEASSARRANPKAARTPDDVLEYVPPPGELTGKATMLEHVRRVLQIGEKKAENYLNVLLERGAVYEHKVKRPGKRDAIFIGRHTPVIPEAMP